MRNKFSKILLFSFTLFFTSLFILLIDPYNLFNISNVVSDEIKTKFFRQNNRTSVRANATWRTINFLNDPTPNIILGDSRIAYISDTPIQEILGDDISNLAIPGCSIKTIIELFWLATSSRQLENVIVQINFNRYHPAINRDILLPVRQLINKPYNYFFNVNYLIDSFDVFCLSLKKDNPNLQQSVPQNDTNWNFTEQVDLFNLKYRKYVYPQNYYTELKKVSTYCSNQDIKLIFVIAPNHHTVHQYIIRNNLEPEYKRFKADIKSLGTTIDLDDGLPISYNDDMYADHFHFKTNVADTLISLIYP